MSLFSITSEMRFGEKHWHNSLQSPLGSFRMTMVLRELLILLRLNIWCTSRMSEVGAQANSILFLTLICPLLFFNSLSGCPIAAAEKLAMSQDKSQLDSPKTGQCPEQGHRYDSTPCSLCSEILQWESLAPHVPASWATFISAHSSHCPLERLAQFIIMSLKWTARPFRSST